MRTANDPLGAGLVGEDGAEIREIDLACLPGGVSKRRSKACSALGRMVRRKSFTAVLANSIAELFDLAQQAAAGQLGEGGDPLPQIWRERCHHSRSRLARAVGRGLKAALDICAPSCGHVPAGGQSPRPTALVDANLVSSRVPPVGSPP